MVVRQLRTSSYEVGADETIVAGEGRGVTTKDDGSTAPVDDQLTVATVRTWVVLAMTLLTAARPVINEANVFPVADSDTGTNLCLTLGEGRDALDALPPGAGLEDALRALARGALLGARGNSGVILSEYLRGFSLGVAGARGSGGAMVDAVVAGLLEASRCAYAAVGQPREGTMLTAGTGAAQAAAQMRATTPGAGLCEVVDEARAGAQAALERSVHELDVLRSAQMLDAGAYGLVLVLDALGLALAEETEPAGQVRPAAAPAAASAAVPAAVSEAAGTITLMDSLAVTDLVRSSPRSDAAAGGQHTGQGAEPAAAPEHTALDGEFEVMFVVEHVAPVEQIEALGSTLRARLVEVGDSVVVVGGADEPGSRDGSVAGTWQVHVHTDVPLEALRAAQDLTRRQVVVRCLPHQVAALAHGAQPARGVVACTASPGLVTELARSGAVVVLRSSAPIGAEDLRRGALETSAAQVLVLPADPETAQHAHALAEATSPWLEVVDSVSDLHVVAAVSAWASEPETASEDTAAHRPHAPGSARLDAVRAAVASLRVTTVDAGDLTALSTAVAALLDTVRSGPDAVLTVLAGDLVEEPALRELAAEAARRRPGIEVVVLASGTATASLVMGVEQP